MEIRVWKDQCDAVLNRIASEKENLVELIKTRASEILDERGKDRLIRCDGSEWYLTLDSRKEEIVAWADFHSDLSSLSIDELQQIIQSLYNGDYITVVYYDTDDDD